jgi:phage tail-like protein
MIPSLEPPLTGFRFVVTLDPAVAYLPPAQALLLPIMAAAGFQEVTGLGADLEMTDYAEGGVNGFVHQLPVRHKWSRISLKRGLVRDHGLWWWYQAGLSQSLGARRDGVIVLLTPLGVPAIGWVFRAGLAAKWSGPELKAQESAVALESLEIAHEGITQIPLSPPGVG